MNTSKIEKLRKEREDKLTELIKACGLFFAFSNEQFDRNKTPLKEGEKYRAVGGGGYIPSGNLEQWNNESKQIDQWYNEEAGRPENREAHIAYQLVNYEAFYTGEIDEVVEVLGAGYTVEEVRKVYNSMRSQY